MEDLDETGLIRKAREGGREAFERLLLPHLPMLLAYVRTICGDYHLAQDAVQETAIIAFRKLHLYFGEADFASWLKAIARREALAARRKGLARIPPAAEEILEAAFDDPAPSAVAPEREALRKCLEALGLRNERGARAVRAHYFEGSPLAEIALAMETNLNTVKTILHRARLNLEECVQRRTREAPA